MSFSEVFPYPSVLQLHSDTHVYVVHDCLQVPVKVIRAGALLAGGLRSGGWEGREGERRGEEKRGRRGRGGEWSQLSMQYSKTTAQTSRQSAPMPVQTAACSVYIHYILSA